MTKIKEEGILELENISKHKREEIKEKASRHWALLRDSVCSVKKALEEKDIKDLTLIHGIHRERKLNHDQPITMVIYISEHREYLTCDGQHFRIFHEDGLKKDVVESEFGLDQVVYCKQSNQFVGWVMKQEDLFLMSKDFAVISQSKAVGPITSAIYNDKTGELITFGPHFVTCWSFRYGARYLTPRRTTRTNFGEDSMFSAMVLEETASKSQKIFFAVGTGVLVHNVFSGLEVDRKNDLHAQPITALTFFNPLKYIITGARDGCIKVWDKNWKTLMVFVGHSKAINVLKIYPYGPSFISASLDCTIRVWNMETCDEIDRTVISEPVQGMDTVIDYEIFYTFAGKHVDLWRLHHLFHLHTNIGSRVSHVKVTDHPSFPRRAVLMCRDSTVRIVCPSNGELITSLLLKTTDGLADVVYAIAEDTLFVLLVNGDIVKATTEQNPCNVVTRWECPDTAELCSHLLVYEYVVDPTAPSDVWSKAREAVQNNKRGGSTKTNKNMTLLLGGRKDGSLCVFDWLTRDITFKIEGHGQRAVLDMIANTRENQLITAGMDNIIKIWRVYPYAEEALTPLMSFYCAQTPSLMTTINTRLGVSFQDPSTATFSVVLYSLGDNSRSDHKPDDDHMDVITGFTSCPRMKIYASCSMDGTIRVWSESNTLIRVLRINTIPHSISFCSPKGDLLIGVNNHLFFISHQRYLPKSYLRKQVCMKFLPIKCEAAIPYDEKRLGSMDKNDVKRLKMAHASFKFSNFVDVLSPEEEAAILQEKIIREKAFGLLEIRDNELHQIRDGALITHDKPKISKQTKKKAFKEYMKMYYNVERIKLPVVESTKEAVKRKLNQELQALEGVEEKEEKYRPETPPLGFFAELGQKENLPPDHACFPASITSGYLPNSVLIKLLYPPPKPEEEDKEKVPYKPPKLTRKQLSEIQSLYPRKVIEVDPDEIDDGPSRGVTFETDEHLTRVLEVELTDEEEEKEPTDLMVSETSSVKIPPKTVSNLSDASVSQAGTPLQQKMRQLRQKKSIKFSKDVVDSSDDEDGPGQPEKSSLMSKFQEIMAKPAPEKEIVNKASETPRDVRTPPVKVATPPAEPVKRPPPSPVKPINKFVSRPHPTPVATRSPTPPPPPIPLPSFIRQFVGADWFDKYFPNCTENTMPKPWTGDVFVNMIVKLLRIAEWLHKVSVTEAILAIHSSEGLSDSVLQNVVKTLLSMLNHYSSPPSCSVPEQKEFILSAVRALAAFAVRDKDVVAELIVQFLDGDALVRSAVLEVMNNLGLVDPHRQLQKELDSWDIWSLEEKTHREELHQMANQWLDRWMSAYQMRIQDTVAKLNTGHSFQGRLGNPGQNSRRGTMQTDVSGGQLKVPESLRTGRTSSTSNGSITITLDRLQESSIMESVTYIDAVTYFCEMMLERELEALKRGEVFSRKQGETTTQAKNTVLVLPKISHKPALVRLGEMHTSKCRRETILHTDFRMPPITQGKQQAPGDLHGFVSYINLPLKHVHLQPFLSAWDEDEELLRRPVLITLRSSQKYFIPSMSHVRVEDQLAV
ncbi:unnamed protein product [Lymnaea stagnalis]|uniref:WD repeat-containing protein 97 n=1 Tax=Lymnaea stagnalis TaxID=6523 RepID=A0AAV2H208_LYMST